jgi:signal transduction histidine kinase
MGSLARLRRHAPSKPGRPADATDRLIDATRLRLAVLTLTLLTALLVGVGLTTAVLAQQELDSSVDRALAASVAAQLSALSDTGASSAPTNSDAPSSAGTSGDEQGGHSGDSATAAPASTGPVGTPSLVAIAGAPNPKTGPSTAVQGDQEHDPASADTFFLYLDADGALIGNPGNVRLVGLPNAGGVAGARTAQDLRTVEVGGVRIRLLTVPLSGDEVTAANGAHFLQAGFVLTLHDEQSASLSVAILVVGLVSLAAAAALTFILTARALVPIRSAFQHERRFVAAASHELRTPTAIIRSTAEVLDREGLISPDGHAFVADIIAESDRLASLVADLSSLATAQAGPFGDLQAVDLAIVAADVVHRAQPMAAVAGVELKLQSGGAPVPVLGDVDRLIQVALILVDNAVRHTATGREVIVTTTVTPRNGELSVADRGPGIPAADRERIFEPFARLDGGGTSGNRAVEGGLRDSGSGLGLAIAQTIVGRLGGSLRVEDRAGGGSVFTIALPRA